MRTRLARATLLPAAVAAVLLLPGGAAAATTTAAATTAAATSAATCDAGRWPRRVQGKPATLVAGARAGDYIWHNENGRHLRVTHHGTAGVVFSGRIVANAPVSVVGVRLEAGDAIALSADRKTVTYRFTNHGLVDGLDLRTACATRLAFAGSMAGTRLPVGRIWIGRNGIHPLGNPFVVTR
jgi:hypothetical protein